SIAQLASLKAHAQARRKSFAFSVPFGYRKCTKFGWNSGHRSSAVEAAGLFLNPMSGSLSSYHFKFLLRIKPSDPP
ncbi:MAG: hypothetical protein KKB02_06995, partial [Alphaproteobacteria bacterium]|nr:hypothetical protein [Alphaproteobacteria bacterium]